MIWLRSLLFNLVFYLSTALVAAGAMVLLPLPRRWMMLLIRCWGWLVLAELRVICGIRLVVTGREHLPAGGAALIAAQHQSALDTIIWPGLVPDCCYVLKHELLRIPLYGAIARKADMISVDRGAGAAAMRHLLREGRAATAAGRQLVIFPEGTRVHPGVRAPFQPGILALAAATGLPVIPVATDSGTCWGRRAFTKRPGVVTLAILPALPAKLPRSALLEQLEAVIEAASDRLAAGRPVDKSVDDFPEVPAEPPREASQAPQG